MLRIHLLQQWFFGMRCHNRHAEAKGYSFHAASGLVHSVESTAHIGHPHCVRDQHIDSIGEAWTSATHWADQANRQVEPEGCFTEA